MRDWRTKTKKTKLDQEVHERQEMRSRSKEENSLRVYETRGKKEVERLKSMRDWRTWTKKKIRGHEDHKGRETRSRYIYIEREEIPEEERGESEVR